MIIQQADLFRGMNRDFVKKVFDITTKEDIEEGDILFSEGDQAQHFFILLKGRVRLSTGKTGQVVHTVSRPGEAFGWSSLVGRDVYSASAKCLVPTKLVKVDRDRFQEIIDRESTSGLDFFKRLAGALGERLINSYGALALAQPSEDQRTYGI